MTLNLNLNLTQIARIRDGFIKKFETIRSYQISIRIGGKSWKIFVCVIVGCVAKEGQFCRRCNVIFSQNCELSIADLRHQSYKIVDHIGN